MVSCLKQIDNRGSAQATEKNGVNLSVKLNPRL